MCGVAFEQVQKRIGNTGRRAPKPENGEKNMFSDFLHCADCGRKLWYKPMDKKNSSVHNPNLL